MRPMRCSPTTPSGAYHDRDRYQEERAAPVSFSAMDRLTFSRTTDRRGCPAGRRCPESSVTSTGTARIRWMTEVESVVGGNSGLGAHERDAAGRRAPASQSAETLAVSPTVTACACSADSHVAYARGFIRANGEDRRARGHDVACRGASTTMPSAGLRTTAIALCCRATFRATRLASRPRSASSMASESAARAETAVDCAVASCCCAERAGRAPHRVWAMPVCS